MFPHEFDSFYEPFLGGGSVLLTARPKSAVVGDLNAWLLTTYAAIRDAWREVAEVLDTLPNNRHDYLRIRACNPHSLDRIVQAAHFIYLNKTCFRGLFRVNRKGMFNVPYGEYQRAYYDPLNLEAVSQALKHVEFRHADFVDTVHGIAASDFAYFDPPYFKLGGYADFNRYTHCQFRETDHERLAALCRKLDDEGVRWAVSNSDTPFVRELFAGFTMIPVQNRREINLNSKERSIRELFIVNYKVSARQRTLFDE